MADQFVDFCERHLWRHWLDGELRTTPLICSTFDVRVVPEQYVLFGTGEDPLLVLTTNPGGAENHQHRQAVQDGTGPLLESMDYATAAAALGRFYSHHSTPISTTAQR